MPDRRLVALLASVLTVALAAAALAVPELVPLDPGRPEAAPVAVRQLAERGDGLSFTLELGALQRETLELGGRSWTALTLPEGGIDGAAGTPGLPTWSGLVVVPAGASLVVSGRAESERRLPDLDLLPVQPDGAEALVIDEAWYAAGRGARPELVSVGAPARLAGVTVVPLTVRPVSYDAAARTVVVADRVQVELDWSGAAPLAPARPLPDSMRRLLADAAINPPERLAQPAANALPGTWLILCPDIASVQAAVQPLVDWRRRQGWNVVTADLGDAGPTNAAIKNWLQAQYQTLDPPLEHVVLVGDATGTITLPTWNETISGYYGEGDHSYTRLDGGDILADVHLGRLSCRSVAELQGIVAKIVAYETTPPQADTGWYTSALVVGDPISSGITTVYCGEWLAQQLYGAGYDNVLQVYGGNFASAMISALNQGRSLFGYRGFAGMSGFTAGHASYLSNGLELPFACFPTCLTGSFRSDTVCRSEAFLANPNGGAIGAIGTATGGTHTRYNNCYFQGTFTGMVNGSDHHQGVAHTRGKLELYRNYQLNEPNAVEIWSTWNNLMGDPATDIWMSVPRILQVEHPVALPAAAGALPVSVFAAGQPVAGARVAAVQGETVVAVGLTDASGSITLPLDGLVDGTLLVTVTGHGLRPYLGEVTVEDQAHWVTLDHWSLDDTAGDGDGQANPGEALQLSLVLANLGSEPVSNVSLSAGSESAWLTVTQPGAAFGGIAAGSTAVGDRALRVLVDPAAPDAEAATLRLDLSSDQGSWVARLVVPLVGSRLEPLGTVFSAGEPLPGTSGELVVDLMNQGSRAMGGASAVLRAFSPWVAVTDSLGHWGALPAGGGGTNASDPFFVTFAADCPRGHLAPLSVVLTQDDGTRRRVDLTVAVGETGQGDPAGPDRYGYLAYDSGDTDYPQAPVYQWVEIDPTRGGSGSDVGLSDFGYEQDDTRTVDLPFSFRYYGEVYDRLSICSNGWISFGETDLRHWRNWTVPSAGSPDAMVAVFWDDLRQSGNDRVYRWYDEAGHRYIVQWSRMPNYHGGIQTCQVILYDPAHHPTTSGDGAIVCQYHTVNNNDYTRGYATAGIQDRTRTDGVLYTYYADDAPGAAPLTAGLAIAYLPVGVLSLAVCEVDPLALDFAAPVGGEQSLTLHVANPGPPGADLIFAVSQVDPLIGGGAKSLAGSTVSVTEAGYEPGVETTLHLSVHNGSPDYEWIAAVQLDFPPGVNVLGASNLTAAGATLTYNGATGDGALAVWDGDGSYNQVISNGQTGQATLFFVAQQGLGDLQIPWQLTGDYYGAPPHTLTGMLTLSSLSGTVRVESPSAGEIWSQGEERTIAWYTSPDITSVDVELSRDGGESWETLASGLPSVPASLAWTVSGPVSGQCRVRVSSAADPTVSDVSDGSFVIQHDLSWLQLDAWNGTVPAGESLDLTVTASATGLADGHHEQLLVITHNGGQAVVVPVSFTVGDLTPVDDLPRGVWLAQNHPNPFNPVTTIDFALPVAGPVDLAIYDLAGRRVATLLSGSRPAGRHAIIWEARDDAGRVLPSGTYLYRLRTEAGDVVRKLLLAK